MKCKECCWFEPQRTEPDSFDFKTEPQRFIEIGICRRHPPQQFVFPSTGETSYCWPTTRSTDWCGEWGTIDGSAEIGLENRIVQVIEVWRDTHDGKPMPLWKLRRSVGDNEAELSSALKRLVGDGILEFVVIPTKGRPFSGYNLT